MALSIWGADAATNVRDGMETDHREVPSQSHVV